MNMQCGACGKETSGMTFSHKKDGRLVSTWTIAVCDSCFASAKPSEATVPPLSTQTLRNVHAANVVVERAKSVATAPAKADDPLAWCVLPVMEYHVLAIFVGCEDDPAATFGPFSMLALAESCCLALASRPTIFSARVIGEKVEQPKRK